MERGPRRTMPKILISCAGVPCPRFIFRPRFIFPQSVPMIYQPVATSNERGETVVRRPFVREDVFVRPLVGFSLLAIGALFLYVFFTGGAPHPIGQGMRKVLGWLIVTGVFTLFGLAPAALGLAALLRGDQIVVDPTTETIE